MKHSRVFLLSPLWDAGSPSPMLGGNTIYLRAQIFDWQYMWGVFTKTYMGSTPFKMSEGK